MQKISLRIVVITLVGLLAVSGAVFYFLNSKKEAPQISSSVKTTPTRDVVAAALSSNPLLGQVRDAMIAKKYTEAISLSQQVLATSSSTDERSVAESSIGQSYFFLGQYDLGAEAYYSVFNNADYAKETRAAALNSIVQQYRATLDVNLLKPVLASVDGLTNEEIYDQLYQKIYDTYPVGIASAWVGKKTLAGIDRGDKKEAQDVYNRYSLDIDRDIEFQSQGTGSAHIVPNTYMAKARFMVFAYKRFGISSVAEISATYEKAANLAEARSNQITKQFALLEYADFLGGQNEIEKAEQVFQILASQKIESVVASNFSKGSIATNWPGLAYLYTKSQIVRDFADRNGIKP